MDRATQRAFENAQYALDQLANEINRLEEELEYFQIKYDEL